MACNRDYAAAVGAGKLKHGALLQSRRCLGELCHPIEARRDLIKKNIPQAKLLWVLRHSYGIDWLPARVQSVFRTHRTRLVRLCSRPRRALLASGTKRERERASSEGVLRPATRDQGLAVVFGTYTYRSSHTPDPRNGAVSTMEAATAKSATAATEPTEPNNKGVEPPPKTEQQQTEPTNEELEPQLKRGRRLVSFGVCVPWIYIGSPCVAVCGCVY